MGASCKILGVCHQPSRSESRTFSGKKMADFSSLLFFLVGIAFSQASVIDLTNENFDSVCIFLDVIV